MQLRCLAALSVIVVAWLVVQFRISDLHTFSSAPNAKTVMRVAVPPRWDATQILPLRGLVAIVTGSNAGIGFATARELARHGAHVVLACRNATRATAAAGAIRRELGDSGTVEVMQLDVGNLESVAAFATAFTQQHAALDILVNSAGVMPFAYSETADGIEAMLATNYLGHFALTARLLPVLQKSRSGARVVAVTGREHRAARIQDTSESLLVPTVAAHDYDAFITARKVQLFRMLFVWELNKRLRVSEGNNVIAVAAHPGVVASEGAIATIQQSPWWLRPLLWLVLHSPFVQSSERGALPILYAATAPGVQGDELFGPHAWNNGVGFPMREEPAPSVVDAWKMHGEALWRESERIVGLRFPAE